MEIYLNVYDLHDSNQYLHAVGSGFYHSGIEVQGYEYSFSDQGIARTRPQLSEFGRLRDHILLGVFPGSLSEINQCISILSNGEFRPGAYNVTSRNCNHFSDSLAMLLLNVHIPSWVNRMANIASNLPGKAESVQSNSDFAAPGKVKDPTLPVKVESSETGHGNPSNNNNSNFFTSIFSWFGSSVSSQERNNTSLPPPPTNSLTTAATKQTTASSNKKELTAEQKKLLAKMKNSKE